MKNKANYLILITLVFILILKLAPHYSFLLGILFSLFLTISEKTRGLANRQARNILQLSIILLGAKLDLSTILTLGVQGIVLTGANILLILLLGHFLAKLFNVASPVSTLISAGTSICGGSAISAVAPVINAKKVDFATAMGVVFLLNAVAVFIFPPIASIFKLSQQQFGVWAALAIHDTSSVVAASQLYGDQALEVGTTLKLLRSLWILPLVMYLSHKNKVDNLTHPPIFILLFFVCSVVFSFAPSLEHLALTFSSMAKVGLSLTMFLIGLNLSRSQLLGIGIRPLLMGSSLWLINMVVTFLLVKMTVS